MYLLLSRCSALLCALVGAVFVLVGCGPPPEYRPPFLDLTRPHPDHIAADGLLRARAKTLAWTEGALYVAHREAVRGLVQAPVEAFDPMMPSIQRAAAELAYADGRAPDALAFLAMARERGQEDAALMAFHIQQLSAIGRHALARSLAAAALSRFPDDPDLRATAAAAFDADPDLNAPIKTLIPERDITAIKALGGGSTVTLRLIKDDKTIAAFKPDQDLGQSMYRSEIAYFRLCILLQCSFRVPHNAHVRVEKESFWLLYNRIDSDKQRNYKGKLSHMLWEVDPQDGLSYVNGTQKEWVPDFVGFNIEAIDAWVQYLRPDVSSRTLSQDADTLIPLLDAASPPEASRSGSLYKRMEGMTLKQVMQQLSDLLVMDFLTNNWDRFSGHTELFGANCHFEPGGIVAIDNGAAFPEWHTSRVAARLKYTQRFSVGLISAIRLLDYDDTLRRLFPNPSKKEIARFKLFWERRTQLLEYVDKLILDHGAANILYFTDPPRETVSLNLPPTP